MNRNSTLFLRALISLIGIGVLALMLWEPHIEGRNVHATLWAIYFNDPFLAYAYGASIPFFVALYQAFKLLGHIGQNKAVSPSSIQALRRIKYCGLALVGFIVVGEVFILLGSSDDRAGGVFMGLMALLISAAIATAAAIFEKRLRR
jgi:hypothetical protein